MAFGLSGDVPDCTAGHHAALFLSCKKLSSGSVTIAYLTVDPGSQPARCTLEYGQLALLGSPAYVSSPARS
ncbi:protein of unknown function [Methylocaldum szegediense]|uniref:Uncharacterized protein n=1 Tax=Methylocaldum szegediense TaxID=73780 RepID=A0ABN8X5S7_9GAMM|nr:protein of unknown function [Methylocaldum szegediense]